MRTWFAGPHPVFQEGRRRAVCFSAQDYLGFVSPDHGQRAAIHIHRREDVRGCCDLFVVVGDTFTTNQSKSKSRYQVKSRNQVSRSLPAAPWRNEKEVLVGCR